MLLWACGRGRWLPGHCGTLYSHHTASLLRHYHQHSSKCGLPLLIVCLPHCPLLCLLHAVQLPQLSPGKLLAVYAFVATLFGEAFTSPEDMGTVLDISATLPSRKRSDAAEPDYGVGALAFPSVHC